MTHYKDALLRECVKALEDGAVETQSYRADLRFRITAALAEKDDGELRNATPGLARACNLAGVDYQTYMRIQAYMPPLPKGDE